MIYFTAELNIRKSKLHCATSPKLEIIHALTSMLSQTYSIEVLQIGRHNEASCAMECSTSELDAIESLLYLILLVPNLGVHRSCLPSPTCLTAFKDSRCDTNITLTATTLCITPPMPNPRHTPDTPSPTSSIEVLKIMAMLQTGF